MKRKKQSPLHDPFKYAVVMGSIFSGFQFFGPFKSFASAEEWACEDDIEYRIIKLQRP